MSRALILIDGKPYRSKDILELRRAQLVAAGAAQASQQALFATLHDARRTLFGDILRLIAELRPPPAAVST